jgi:4-amino-4-deoxy-L-arabinose transferase-like glycosyltransferase
MPAGTAPGAGGKLPGPAATAEAALEWAAADRRRARVCLVVLCLVLFLPWFAGFPVTDRDEALFAQSSRQMAETGDLIRIRFQDEARNLKPAGIYWLQSAAAALTTGPRAAAIWPYRLPSLLGAVLAVLLTHAIALRLLPRGAALAAAALLAASFVLAGEARLAKTDAMLLAATLGSMAVLLRVWLDRPPRIGWWAQAQFWGCLAAGLLLKGPIGPLVVALTLLALAAMARRLAWAAPLWRGGGGPLLFLALALPWYAAITLAEGRAFWQASLGGDLLDKVAAGEGRSLPPGSHAALLAWTFWPGSLLLVLLLPRLRDPALRPVLRIAAAWVLPFWLVLEATPTKLLHYPLPVFPALAIAAAAALFTAPGPPPSRWARAAALAVGALGLLVPGAMTLLSAQAGGEATAAAVALLLGAGLGLAATGTALAAGARAATVLALAATAALAHAATLTAAARTPWFWAAAAVARQVAALPACPGRRLAAAGFREPSLVFLSPVPVDFTDPASAAARLRMGSCDAVLLPRDAEAAATGGLPLRRQEVSGFALGAGRAVDLVLLSRPGEGAP